MENREFLEARSFGKIAVATPGVPVPLTTNPNLRVARLRFAVAIGETGRVFLGVQGVNKATGAGVIKEFWPTGAGGGIADELVLESLNGDLLRPADYWIDANNAGEGLIVAYWVWVPHWVWAHSDMIRELKIWWRLRPLIPQFKELTKMRFSVNIAIQLLALVAQAVNATQDLLPGRGKFWAMVVLSAVQGVTAVLAHFANPDGTPAAVPYIKK